MNELLSFFPIDNDIKEIRSNQQIALDAIWQAIQNEEKKITLSAPTGSGKSKIGEAVLRYFQSQGKVGCYTSPLNSLVDQVEAKKHIISGISTLKGKRYYDCIAKGNSIHCDEGYCAKKICYITRDLPKEHRFKRECKDCKLPNCVCRNCIYKEVFRQYRHSQVGNTNVSLWLMGIVPEGTQVLIIDEVDSLEDFVRMNNTVSVPYHVKGNDFSEHIQKAEEYVNAIEPCLDCEENRCHWLPKSHPRHQAKIDSIRNMANDYSDYAEPWVIRSEIKGDKLRTTYEPVTVNRFISPMLEDLDFILTMSATPPRWENYSFIEVPSSFPVDIRPCYYKPLGRMSFDNREAVIPKLAEFLTTLKGKTIVHCVSYPNAERIANALRKLGIFPLQQVKDNKNGSDDSDTVQRWDAVRSFKASRKQNEILLSVNLSRGTDFWEPDIQNNVIAFVPFQNPTDLLVQAKDKVLGETWKNEATAITIDQSHGRIHRGIFYLKDIIKDHPDLSWLPTNAQGMIKKRTIITDSNFNNGRGRLAGWYLRNKRYFSNTFNEALISHNYSID